MDVRFPDGTVIKNVPEGTTKQQLLDKLQAKGYDVQKLTTPAAEQPAATSEPTFGEQVLGGAASTADLLASSAVGTAQWLGHPIRRIAGLVTGETAEDIAASEARVMGTVGSPTAPVLGEGERTAYERNPARQAMEYVGSAMDAAAEEASATTTIPKSDILNMMQSAMAVIPVKVPGVKTAGRMVRGGANYLAGVVDPRTKFYMDVAEGRAPELIAAARSPQAEIIPGVRPTFAQATADVGLPRVAAVGEEAKTLPTTATTAQAIKDAQEAARVRQLDIIERSPESRARAEEVRSQRSDPLYDAAETAGDVVDVKPTLNYIDGLIKAKPGNDKLLSALREVRRGLVKTETRQKIVIGPKNKMKMVDVKVEVPRVNAGEISSTLDGMKELMKREGNEYIQKELTNIKDDLVAAIPSMKEAQAAFKKGSRTLNQRDMATYLKDKLVSAIPDSPQRAASFAQAVRDAPRSIKNALENAPPYETFTEAGMSPAQIALIDRVVIDLSRDARVKELAAAGAEAAPKLKEATSTIALPPWMDKLMTVVNMVIKRLEGKVSDKVAADIAMEFLDARRAADALETATRRTAKRAAVGNAVTAPGRAVAKGYGVIEPGVRAGIVAAPNVMAEENRNSMAR